MAPSLKPPNISITHPNTRARSTAASPMQGTFSLSCRSPLRFSFDVDSISSRTLPLRSPSLRSPGFSAEFGSARRSRSDRTKRDGEGSSSHLLQVPEDQGWSRYPYSPGLPPLLSREEDDGKLGVLSAINIIVGKTLGVGVYSVPSAIIAGVGSVGMTLVVWIVGILISFCGLAVYLDLGTALPRSGGERVYLERIFRRPRMLATCIFLSYVVLLGFSTPNAIVLGEYALYAARAEPNRWNVRAIAVVAVSLPCYLHARHPNIGLRLLNVLGIVKVLIMLGIIVSGVAAGLTKQDGGLEARRLNGDPLSGTVPRSAAQRNFGDMWAGSSLQPYDYATALLKVLYCFRGYGAANQVLSDVRDPVRTLKTAAPVALGLVAFVYLAVNVAFLLVLDKTDMEGAGAVVAGTFFEAVYGPCVAAHALPLFVMISAAGSIVATSYAQARVNEELAKDGLLPWSDFWHTTTAETSAEPRKLRDMPPTPAQDSDSPVRGLFLHWLVSVLVIVLPPPGPVYNFLIDIGSYPVSVLSLAVSGGLYYLYHAPGEAWISPCPAPRAAVLLFAAANAVLLVLPWIPPRDGTGEGAGFVWFAYPATGLAVLGTGAIWWLWWSRFGRGAKSTEEHRVEPIETRECLLAEGSIRQRD